jgi:DNA-binding NarL/FixJ family response regulator
MTLMTLIIASGIFVAVGLNGWQGIVASMIIGGVVCTALSMAGGMVTDMTIGYWIGTTPAKQQSPLERDQLTSTEMEVLRRIALGKSVKEIAAERNSSIHTIATHKKNIFRKINVNTIYEATKYALRAGLVEMVEYYI